MNSENLSQNININIDSIMIILVLNFKKKFANILNFWSSPLFLTNINNFSKSYFRYRPSNL